MTMRLKIDILLLCAVICTASCSKNRGEGNGLYGEIEAKCLCPPTIHLQPYGNFSQREANKLGKELTIKIEEIFGVELDYEVHPSLPLSDTLMNDGKTRYRAEKMIHSMAADANKHNIYIGLTHKDISCSIHGKKDWGVQGLSLIPGNACVASTFRVKDRKDFWKVVCHEFIHTYFSYNHCPKDDPSCLMQAAKGHPRYKGKNALCSYCSSVLRI